MRGENAGKFAIYVKVLLKNVLNTTFLAFSKQTYATTDCCSTCITTDI